MHQSLDLVEIVVSIREPTALSGQARAGGIVCSDACGAQQFGGYRRLTMNKFSAELDWRGQSRHELRPDAAAQPLPGLKENDRATGTGELGGRRQPSGPTADHRDVEVGLRRQVTLP
jgi:hypothetical protein